MNIFLMLAILVTNLIAVLIVYQFVKKLEKMDIIKFIAVSFAIIYVLVTIAYWISGFGIDSKINDAAKQFITFLFVPVDVIILIPFVAVKYAKYKDKKISKRDFAERLIKVSLVAIIILTIECIYFKNMKQNIKVLNTNIEQTTSKEIKNNNNSNNSIVENVTTNQIDTTLVNTIENE